MKKPSIRGRILIVDDHPITREGIKSLVLTEKGLTVCGCAEDQNSALDKIDTLKPDLVLVDISLKGSNGIELLKCIKARWRNQKTLVLSMHDESLYAVRALRAGAAGYVMKQEATEKLLIAISMVLNGGIYLSEKMESKMMQQLVGRRDFSMGVPIEDLSDRELEVFGLLGDGHGTRQIAEELHLSMKTIESHRAHIKEKLGLKNATELVQHAIEWRKT